MNIMVERVASALGRVKITSAAAGGSFYLTAPNTELLARAAIEAMQVVPDEVMVAMSAAAFPWPSPDQAESFRRWTAVTAAHNAMIDKALEE